MNEFSLKENVERLIAAFSYILDSYPDEESNINPKFDNLGDIGLILDSIFKDTKCKDVVFTQNLDNMFFGVRVSPEITKDTIIKIISTPDIINIDKYSVEIDSKILDAGLTAEEIAAYVLYEISAMIASNDVIDKLRTYIDIYLTSTDDVISIRDSVHYYQLIIFAIKDTLTKLSSMIYKETPEDLLNSNSFINALEMNEAIINAHQKIIASENGPGDSMRTPNVVLLRWMFIMYRSMDINSKVVKDSLKDAYDLTGSKLEKFEIEKTLNAIDHIDNMIVEGCDLITFLESSNIKIDTVNESLFGGLKKRGLRSLEDDLYTVALQIKNLETENDAIYTMRFINTRLNILEDYLYENQDIRENERRHWEEVAQRYRSLREELVRKKIWNKKQYGLFYDYNQMFEGDPADEGADFFGEMEGLEEGFIKDAAKGIKDITKKIKEQIKNRNKKSTQNTTSSSSNSTSKTIQTKQYTPEEMKEVEKVADKILKIATKSINAKLKDRKIREEIQKDFDKYDVEEEKVPNTVKFGAFDGPFKDGYFVAELLDGSGHMSQDANIAFSGLLYDIAEELEANEDINKTASLSIGTGDGDEGCLYIDIMLSEPQKESSDLTVGTDFFVDDVIEEGVVDDIKKKITDLTYLKQQWAKVANGFVKHKWIYRYIKDEKQYEMLQKYYKMLTDDDTTYKDYKKAFAFIANFFGLPKDEIIIEWLEFQKDKTGNEPDRVAIRYSKGKHKVKIPDDIRLIHTSPVDNIKNLEPAFRSKTKGKFMYPDKRCFFTVTKAINPTKAGTQKMKLFKYTTSADVGEAYIDPTYTDFADGSIYIQTETPIPVMKFQDKMEQIFGKIKDTLPGKKKSSKDDKVNEEVDYFEEELNLTEDDTSWYDAEAQDILEMFDINYEVVEEGALKDFIETIKQWKTSNEAHAKRVFKSTSISDEDYNKLSEIIKTLTDPEVKYSDYSEAFKELCNYCHTIPAGTIITKYNLRKGEKDNNTLEVEYSENTKKIKLPDGVKLFHISKVPNLTKLIPQFKGKSERGYLYDKPRIYFTINKWMPKFLADYKPTDKLHKYECKQDIDEVYVDPLVWSISQGAVYVETNNDIPVEEVKGPVENTVDKVANVVKGETDSNNNETEKEEEK